MQLSEWFRVVSAGSPSGELCAGVMSCYWQISSELQSVPGWPLPAGLLFGSCFTADSVIILTGCLLIILLCWATFPFLCVSSGLFLPYWQFVKICINLEFPCIMVSLVCLKLINDRPRLGLVSGELFHRFCMLTSKVVNTHQAAISPASSFGSPQTTLAWRVLGSWDYFKVCFPPRRGHSGAR